MSRTVRLSLALLFALMMVIATASGALAFDPPAHGAADGSAAAAMHGVEDFPAVLQGNPPANAGPWHSTGCGPNPNPSGDRNGTGEAPIDFDEVNFPGTCP